LYNNIMYKEFHGR